MDYPVIKSIEKVMGFLQKAINLTYEIVYFPGGFKNAKGKFAGFEVLTNLGVVRFNTDTKSYSDILSIDKLQHEGDNNSLIYVPVPRDAKNDLEQIMLRVLMILSPKKYKELMKKKESQDSTLALALYEAGFFGKKKDISQPTTPAPEGDWKTEKPGVSHVKPVDARALKKRLDNLKKGIIEPEENNPKSTTKKDWTHEDVMKASAYIFGWAKNPAKSYLDFIAKLLDLENERDKQTLLSSLYYRYTAETGNYDMPFDLFTGAIEEISYTDVIRLRHRSMQQRKYMAQQRRHGSSGDFDYVTGGIPEKPFTLDYDAKMEKELQSALNTKQDWREVFADLNDDIDELLSPTTANYGLLVYGSTGTGKTTEIKKHLDGIGKKYEHKHGEVIDYKELVKTLYENRNKDVIIFDDCDSILNKQNNRMTNTLMKVLETTPKRTLTVEMENKEKKSFPFKARIIFVTNKSDMSRFEDALLGRCKRIEITMDKSEIIDKIVNTIDPSQLKVGNKSATEEDIREVAKALTYASERADIPVNYRSFQRAVVLKLTKPDDWFNRFIRSEKKK